MVNNQRVEVCYNVQTTVDSKHKLILDHEVTNEGTDYRHLSEMGLRAKEMLGVEKLEVLANKGYYAAGEIKACVEQGIMPYIPEKEGNKYDGRDLPQVLFPEREFRYDREKDYYICPRGRTVLRWEHEEILEAMRQRVASNKPKVKMRQWLSKHSFGTIKRGFNQGYLLLRGLSKVGVEISLTMLTYNIKRVISILGVRALTPAVMRCPVTLPSLLSYSTG